MTVKRSLVVSMLKKSANSQLRTWLSEDVYANLKLILLLSLGFRQEMVLDK